MALSPRERVARVASGPGRPPQAPEARPVAAAAMAASPGGAGDLPVPKGEFHLAPDLVAGILGLPPGAAVGLEERHAALRVLGSDLVGGYPALPDGRWVLRLAEAAGRGMARGGGAFARRFGLPGPAELDWGPVRWWARETDLFVWAVVPGVFSDLAFLYGFLEFLELIASDPGGASALAREMVPYNLALAERAVEAGAHGVLVADDIAYDRGLFMPPGTWRGAFLPALAAQVEGLRRLGVPVFFHSDGDLRAVLPDLAELGVDGLHGLQPSAGMDLGAIGSQWGGRFCLWGNVELDVVLAGTPEAVEAAAAAALRGGRAGGRHIFGTCVGDLPADVDPGRLKRLYAAAAAPGAG